MRPCALSAGSSETTACPEYGAPAGRLQGSAQCEGRNAGAGLDLLAEVGIEHDDARGIALREFILAGSDTAELRGARLNGIEKACAHGRGFDAEDGLPQLRADDGCHPACVALQQQGARLGPHGSDVSLDAAAAGERERQMPRPRPSWNQNRWWDRRHRVPSSVAPCVSAAMLRCVPGHRGDRHQIFALGEVVELVGAGVVGDRSFGLLDLRARCMKLRPGKEQHARAFHRVAAIACNTP